MPAVKKLTTYQWLANVKDNLCREAAMVAAYHWNNDFAVKEIKRSWTDQGTRKLTSAEFMESVI